MTLPLALRAGLASTTLVLIAGCTSTTDEDPESAAPTSTIAPQSRWGDGIIVHGTEPESRWTEVVSLPEAGNEPFLGWAAFDQDTGRFLYGDEWGTSATQELTVLAPGLDAPVAQVSCGLQYTNLYSFGPGTDEVTALLAQGSQPDTAQVCGFDDELRDWIDLTAVVGPGRGISDLEWAPDGSQLAVSTFAGEMEPTCRDVPNDARVYLFARGGGDDPVLLHRRAAQRGTEGEPPVLNDLAWSPDGQRLGLVTSTYCTQQPAAPTLVAVDVESGQGETLFEFDRCGTCIRKRHGFAWSPDGTRVAVTNGTGIGAIDADGEGDVRLVRRTGERPLAWLALAPSAG